MLVVCLFCTCLFLLVYAWLFVSLGFGLFVCFWFVLLCEAVGWTLFLWLVDLFLLGVLMWLLGFMVVLLNCWLG